MALNRFHIVSPIALMAFSACRSPYVTSSGGAVGGAVVNGPLNSALVFLDYDFDGILDANEPNARTNQFGEYELTSTQGTYDLVAIADAQTVDTSSGATFAGITLKAPGGAGVISPTSTLMQEGNLTATEVAAVLGLPDGVDPLTFNPFNVDETDATAVAQALEVAKISKQITTAISRLPLQPKVLVRMRRTRLIRRLTLWLKLLKQKPLRQRTVMRLRQKRHSILPRQTISILLKRKSPRKQ
jgi:hypothetical protein